jgi:hypothetical protein
MEDNFWLKLLSAAFLVAMLVFLFPAVKNMYKNSPKGSSSDWMSALIPLAIVALFIVLLVQLV